MTCLLKKQFGLCSNTMHAFNIVQEHPGNHAALKYFRRVMCTSTKKHLPPSIPFCFDCPFMDNYMLQPIDDDDRRKVRQNAIDYASIFCHRGTKHLFLHCMLYAICTYIATYALCFCITVWISTRHKTLQRLVLTVRHIILNEMSHRH